MNARDDEFRSRFPDVGITLRPPSAPKRKRLAMAEQLLTTEKLLGTGRDNGVVFAEIGFRDENEYWSDRIAGVMSAPDFVHTLAIHRLNATAEGVDGYKLDLSHALNFAFENREPWFIKTETGELRLRCRQVAEYLLSQPKCEHLVPQGLRAFLDSQRSVAVPSIPPAAKRQQRKRDQIKEAMGAWLRQGHSPAELDGLKEESLVTTFGGRDGDSREVYRTARREVLAEVGWSRSTRST